MEDFAELIQQPEQPEQQAKVQEIFSWIKATFPNLEPVVKWKQPMYQHDGTFIIGFSFAKGHMSVTLETEGQEPFINEIEANDYTHTQQLFRIKWQQPVDYNLLEKMIRFNIEDKRGMASFWRSTPSSK